MRDFSAIRRVRVSEDVQEVNNLLSDDWVLMDICKRSQTPLFILGREFNFGDLDVESLKRPAVRI